MKKMEINTLALLQISFMHGQERLVSGLHKAGFPEIRPVHGKVFAYIDRENGSQLVDLAKRSNVTKQFMSQLIKQLEELDYIKKTIHPTDQRAFLVKLTAKGKRSVAAADKIILEMEKQYAELLHDHGYQKLRELLSKICFQIPIKD